MMKDYIHAQVKQAYNTYFRFERLIHLFHFIGMFSDEMLFYDIALSNPPTLKLIKKMISDPRVGIPNAQIAKKVESLIKKIDKNN